MNLNSDEVKTLENHVIKKLKPIIDEYDMVAKFIISSIVKAKDSSNETLEHIRNEILDTCKVADVQENSKLDIDDLGKFIDDILETVKSGKVISKYGDKTNKVSSKIRVYNSNDNDKQQKKREHPGSKIPYQSKRRKDEQDYDYHRGGYQHYMGDRHYHPHPANIGMQQQWPQHHIPNPNDVNTGFIPPSNPPYHIPHQTSDFKPKKKHKVYKGSKDPNATTITVVNIPEEYNVIDKLNEHFKKFGQIVNIEIFTEEKKANIKFLTHENALSAIKSPEPVFDNRFIKIFWAAPESDHEEITPKPKIKPEKPQIAKSTTFISEEYKKILEQKEKKNEEMLEQLQKEIDECIEKIKSTSDQLLNTELSESEREDLLQLLTEEEEKKRKLVSKYKELKYKNKKPFKPTYPIRGRGGYSRGYPPPFRGRGARGREVAKSLTLDNRPKSIIIKGKSDEIMEDDLKSHFEKFGKVVNVTSQDGDIIVEMDSRRTAEKAFNHGKEINGKFLDMDWYEGTITHQETEPQDISKDEKLGQGDIVEVYNPGDENNIHDDYDED